MPSVIGALTVVADLPQLAQMFAMIGAGLCEGTILGLFQARVLSKYIKQFNSSAWIKATALGAGVAWTIGMLPSTIGEKLQSISLWVLIPSAVVLGSALLLSIGAAQYIVLKRYVSNAYKWIWINVAAWLVGLVVVCGCIFAAPSGLAFTILFSAVGGLGMAFSMAAVTGVYAARAMRRRKL